MNNVFAQRHTPYPLNELYISSYHTKMNIVCNPIELAIDWTPYSHDTFAGVESICGPRWVMYTDFHLTVDVFLK